MLPLALVNPLKDHLKRVKDLHEKELAEGFGKVYLPYALERKYPNGAKEWMWQYELGPIEWTGKSFNYAAICSSSL